MLSNISLYKLSHYNENHIYKKFQNDISEILIVTFRFLNFNK